MRFYHHHVPLHQKSRLQSFLYKTPKFKSIVLFSVNIVEERRPIPGVFPSQTKKSVDIPKIHSIYSTINIRTLQQLLVAKLHMIRQDTGDPIKILYGLNVFFLPEFVDRDKTPVAQETLKGVGTLKRRTDC